MKHIQITKYQFEKCRTTYEDESEAIECEKYHNMPVKIVGCEFTPKLSYPPVITVSFENGEEAIYQLRKLAMKV